MWKFDECNDSKARNRLSLTRRVQAIQAYEKTPNYSKVGLMFKCSSKQIRTIIKNKEKILALYASVPIQADEDKPSNKRRQKKISLLGAVMYEWFLRARRNPSVCIISYKLIQNVALEAKRILNVDNFYPNSGWLLHFRRKFNISDLDMKIQSNDPGPTDLNIEEIVADVVVREKNNASYCQKKSNVEFGCHDDSSISSTRSSSIIANESSSFQTGDSDGDDEEHEPGTKYPKLEPVDVIEIKSDDEEDDAGGNGDDDDDDDSMNAIHTIDEALQHLKPLEDFALMKEDYRVIGLISQLETILKKSKGQ